MDELKHKIGQMVVVRTSGYLFDHQFRYPVWEASNSTLRGWLTNLNLGGVILLGGSAGEIALKTRQLQDYSPTPLLIAADIEEGVGQRFPGATFFPPPMAIGEIAGQNMAKAREYAFKMGAVTAKEALTIGINWILAPVVDVNNNPANPVINIRSFGDNPEIVAELARSFLRGANSYPVLTTAKHFPGHGDTGRDSHLELPVIAHDNDRLSTIELPPFTAAISAGVDSVMSGHLLIPAWDADYPATLSKNILTGKLRENLAFEGLIVTDALIMGGVTGGKSPGEIAVMAVEAGADILLMPEDPVLAIEAVYNAVRNGRIPEERIGASFARIKRAKAKLFPRESQPGDIFNLSPALETVGEILGDSNRVSGITVKERGGRNLIIVDDVLNSDFLDRSSPAITVPRGFGYELQLVDRVNLIHCLKSELPTILQIFIRGNPFRGSAGLDSRLQDLYRDFLNGDGVRGLIVYGSPYIFEWFEERVGDSLPRVFTYGQMSIAQKLACETLFGIANPAGNLTDTFI